MGNKLRILYGRLPQSSHESNIKTHDAKSTHCKYTKGILQPKTTAVFRNDCNCRSSLSFLRRGKATVRSWYTDITRSSAKQRLLNSVFCFYRARLNAFPAKIEVIVEQDLGDQYYISKAEV